MEVVLLTLAVSFAALAQTPSFDYDHAKPLDVRIESTETRGAVRIDDISFASIEGGRISAYLVVPPGRGKAAGALFVHWYDSESPLSNRTQFLKEAVALGQHGLMSLLVSTPWSDPQWYAKRDVARDFENSVQEVRALWRALDVLSAQPRIDRNRMALVGHDFGAMYGILAAASEKRVSAVALQAFTGSFSDWFLYNQKQLSPEAQQGVIDRLAPLDPIRFLRQLGSTPVLLQFAEKDFYVPREKAEALYAAVSGPKQILWYQAGHGLNDQASQDRQKWLRQTLKLK
ncbi:MAG: dienelactone hydrolase family protein [Acidobacteriota bacterium]